MRSTDYNRNDLQSVLMYMRNQFGAGVFEEPPRMVSILLDLAPGLKRDGNVLRQMSNAGLLRELRTASESGAERERTRLTAKSRLWLTEYLMLPDEKADYFMTALQAAYGLEVTPPKPSAPPQPQPTPKPQAVTRPEPAPPPPPKTPPTPPKPLKSSKTPLKISKYMPKPKPQPSKPAIIDSGRTGECRWTLDRNDVFRVSGQGRMGTYSIGVRPPWWDYRERMKVAIIERGVTSIGDGTFEGCAALTSVTIPDSVISIKDNAFSGCVGLTRMMIPNSVTSIEAWAFSGCSGLTSVLIPHSVTAIKCWVFAGCVGLTSVNIPNGVTEIKSYAFAGCAGLKIVTIPDSVTSIKHWAFDGCESLNQVSVSGRAAIDPDAFPPHTRIIRR